MNSLPVEKLPLILVVDDDDIIRDMTREALEDEGFSVRTAKNGLEGIEVFKQIHPDIVIMDVEMPEMDGFETCANMRRIPIGEFIPILITTGMNDLESIRKAYDAGATDFINKPVSFMILTQRVRYMLRASNAIQQLSESKNRLAHAQRIAGLGGWMFDSETKQFQLSELTCSIFGIAPIESGITYGDYIRMIHPDDADAVKKRLDQTLMIGKPFHADHRILLPDGNIRYVVQQAKISDSESNKKYRITGTIQDITDRKKAELLESDRNQILEMIIRNEPIQQIYEWLVKIVERQKPGSLCCLSMIQNQSLQWKAFLNMPKAFIKETDAMAIDASAGCWAASLYTGDTFIISDIETHKVCEKQRELARAYNIRSCYTSPIASGKGHILGMIGIFNRQPYQPSEAELNLIEVVSRIASIAVEKYKLAEELEHQARHDVLTGLPNRAFAMEFLERAVAQAARQRYKIAILFIDLDRFKNINDSLGHHIGDMLLKQTANRFQECTRTSDILARMGGDEFVQVLNDVDGRKGAVIVAERILDILQPPFEIETHTLHIRASIGISIYPDDGQDPITLQKNADAAMYYAKNLGGNRPYWFTPEIKAAALERLEIENELRKSLERNDFEVFYQPQYELQPRRLTGFEALIRWNHPELGRIPPGKFIPIAEDSGLIVPIGTWVMRESCRQNKAWQDKGYGFFKVAVNVSVVQFMRNDFVDTVKAILKETGLEAKWLELEITETLVINDLKAVTKRLSELKILGIEIAIDDFGTGYSSMSYLHQLPVNCLKIDQSFVRELEIEGENASRIRTMIKTLIDLAKNLGLKVIAEGIENLDQFHFLIDMGCEMGQGYYFDVPLSAAELKFDSIGEENKRDAPKSE